MAVQITGLETDRGPLAEGLRTQACQAVQRRRLETAITTAGPRYSPKLNVDLPISSVFDALGRTPAFFVRLREIQGKIQRAYSRCRPGQTAGAAHTEYQGLDAAIAPVLSFFRRLPTVGGREIPFTALVDGLKRATEALWKCEEELRRLRNRREQPAQSTATVSSEDLSSATHYLYELLSALRALEQLCESTQALVANQPALLLGGVAGTGKTHLFCDVAARRLRAELPTFIFLGEEFTNPDPWAVMAKLLGMAEGAGTLLRALNEYGRRRRTRVLVMVDALNEAPVRVAWKSLLKARKYRHVAVAASVRTGFERQVLSTSSLSKFVREEHHGFELREWEAVTRFFAAFKVPLPEVPVLTPEFQNPLFLMLFCKGLQGRQRRPARQAFRGHEGSTYIFEQFVKNGADRLAKSFGLRPGRGSRGYVIWDTVVDPIAEHMAQQAGIGDRISESAALAIIEVAHPDLDSRRLLRSLERELLLTRVPRYSRRFREIGYEYRFPFQKFSDHLIVRYLLNQHLKEPRASFQPSARLGKILQDGWNRGLIEALAIQVPERLKGSDLVSVAPPEFAQSDLGVETFLESLAWRSPQAFNVDESVGYINQMVIRSEPGLTRLLDVFLTVATIPEHPFNAEQLHNHLWRFSMPERDAWWLPFLHRQYGENQAVDRLLAWAWESGPKTHVGDKPLELAAVALTWFLASSNRFVRDRATKALVSMLTDRLDVVERLVERFHGVNDPYVAERLYAVAYGCALRATPGPATERLAQSVYDHVFAKGAPPIDVMLRDYARGVIETALHHGSQLRTRRRFRPPYRSSWPGRIPSETALKKTYYERHQQCKYLWFSVLGSGDFDRYVVQPNFNHFSKRRLGAPRTLSKRERYEAFEVVSRFVWKREVAHSSGW